MSLAFLVVETNEELAFSSVMLQILFFLSPYSDSRNTFFYNGFDHFTQRWTLVIGHVRWIQILYYLINKKITYFKWWFQMYNVHW